MRADGALRFSCASCGKEYSLDPRRIPAGGAQGPCKQCGAAIEVRPDGSLAGAVLSPAPGIGAPPAPPPASASASSWEIQREGEALGPFTTEEMKELVAAGRLLPDQLVRPVGGAWTLLAACPALCPPPAAQAPAPAGEGGAPEERWGSPQECYAHPQARPTFECTQCQRYLCPACVRESSVRGSIQPIRMCGACGGLAKPLEARVTWRPFYRDMGQVLTAPLKGHALLYFGILSFLQVLKIPAAFGWMWGLAAVFILTVFQTSFYLHLIQQVANGSYEFPEWPESSNFVDMMVAVLKVIFVSLVSLIPAIAVAVVTGVGALGLLLGGAGGRDLSALGPVAAAFLVLGLFYLLYLPMCITIVAVFDTVLPALNPVLILRIIFRIGPPWAAAVAVLAAMTVWDAALSSFLLPIPVLGKVLAAPISVYCSLVSCYVLGRVVYENEEKIGWA